MSPLTCKSCDTEFDGRYCPQCGQRVISQFNFSYLWSLLHQDFLEVDRGLWRTIKDLTIRPGHMIQEYLKGKTKPYFSPIKYLLIWIAFFYTLMAFGSFNSAGEVLVDPQWKEKYFFNDHTLFSTDGINDLNGILFNRVIASNLAFYFLLLLPFLAFTIRFFFRQLNFTEHIIVLAYIWGHIIFLFIPMGILIFVPTALLGFNQAVLVIFLGLEMVVLFGFFTFTYKQLTTSSWVKTFFKLLGSIYAGYFLFFAVIFLAFAVAKTILV